ncbi:PEP-CTERM sorting domain-containing protein [Methylophilus medardicus]|nr:PEP-CTERM sorting domain-containing protein [Methylophilus medardicus]
MSSCKKYLSRIVVAALFASSFTAAQAATSTAIFWGPSAYLSANDIPVGFYAGGSPQLLDTLEDGSLDASLSANNGAVYGPTGIADSVDSDDGNIDGFGTAGRSWFSGTVTFTFVGNGPLPTAFGLVWTDGSGTITFSAQDANGQSLGSNAFNGIPDNTFGGTTGDDRFFGVQFAGGIKSITIGTGGGIEVDHIQYGQMVSSVPEPSLALMLSLGLMSLINLRRKNDTTT